MLPAPSGSPLDFQVNVGNSVTVTLSWSAPAEEDQNGIISGYTLSCQPEFRGLPTAVNDPGEYLYEGLTPATEYECAVYASTAVGDGPPVMVVFTTPEDGMV